MAYLDGKVAVVTGSARGIGQEIALKLASEGADLALSDVKTEWLEETQSKVQALGRRAEVYAVDVSNGAQVQAGVARMVEDFGQLDIVVNNAGITRDGLLMRMSEEDWDMVMDINLKGTFLMTKAAAKYMMKKRTGVFVNIASVIGLMGNPGQANYGASKAGVSNLTKTTAKELAARGIRANAIAPGFIKTKMTDALTDETRDAMLSVIPMKDFGTPEDVANVALFLASDLSRYVTGQTLSVCGGMVTA
jgi:3-oxoacyl-[acyl-carrier protein] reductase